MGSPFPGSMAMPDDAEHFPIMVDRKGRGPVTAIEARRVACWCGTPKCLEHAKQYPAITSRMVREAMKAQSGRLVPARRLGVQIREHWNAWKVARELF